MARSEYATLGEVSDILGVEWWRLSRLAHYLELDPTAPRIPRVEVGRIAGLGSPEERFVAIRHWLLADVQCPA